MKEAPAPEDLITEYTIRLDTQDIADTSDLFLMSFEREKKNQRRNVDTISTIINRFFIDKNSLSTFKGYQYYIVKHTTHATKYSKRLKENIHIYIYINIYIICFFFRFMYIII